MGTGVSRFVEKAGRKVRFSILNKMRALVEKKAGVGSWREEKVGNNSLEEDESALSAEAQ